MLQVRVHDACIICTIACYGIRTMVIAPDAYLHITGWYMVMVGQMHDLHVKNESTWGWYHLQDCMLWDWDNDIPNCDCKPGISYYSTFGSLLSFAVLFSFLLSYFAVLHLRLTVAEFAFLLQLQLQASTLYLDRSLNVHRDPHMCRGCQVFITANSTK